MHLAHELASRYSFLSRDHFSRSHEINSHDLVTVDLMASWSHESWSPGNWSCENWSRDTESTLQCNIFIAPASCLYRECFCTAGPRNVSTLDSLARNLKCVDSNHKSTSLTFVRIQCIHGDNHNNRDYLVDNNCCMNSGYRPSLTRRPWNNSYSTDSNTTSSRCKRYVYHTLSVVSTRTPASRASHTPFSDPSSAAVRISIVCRKERHMHCTIHTSAQHTGK